MPIVVPSQQCGVVIAEEVQQDEWRRGEKVRVQQVHSLAHAYTDIGSGMHMAQYLSLVWACMAARIGGQSSRGETRD